MSNKFLVTLQNIFNILDTKNTYNSSYFYQKKTNVQIGINKIQARLCQLHFFPLGLLVSGRKISTLLLAQPYPSVLRPLSHKSKCKIPSELPFLPPYINICSNKVKKIEKVLKTWSQIHSPEELSGSRAPATVISQLHNSGLWQQLYVLSLVLPPDCEMV